MIAGIRYSKKQVSRNTDISMRQPLFICNRQLIIQESFQDKSFLLKRLKNRLVHIPNIESPFFPNTNPSF